MLLSPHLLAAIVLLARSASAPAQPQVTITGGVDESGHNYVWTVTHERDAPIVAVELPHYMADICSGPEGWSTQLTNVLGHKGRTGVYTIKSADGLPRGEQATFQLRVGPLGAPVGRRDALVRFGDGAEVKVRVQVPVKPSFLGGHLSLVGLGAVFVLRLIRAVKKRRRHSAAPADPA